MTLYTFLKLFTLVVFFLNMEGCSNYLVISGQYWIRSPLNLLSFKMVSLHCFNLSLYEPCSPHTCGTALHCTASNTSMYFSRHGLYACTAYMHKKYLHSVKGDGMHIRWSFEFLLFSPHQTFVLAASCSYVIFYILLWANNLCSTSNTLHNHLKI